MREIVERILREMSSVNQPQRNFMVKLLFVLTVFQGRATYRNLSRYCEMHEKRFSRWYSRDFDFSSFNTQLLQEVLPKKHERIAALDASFLKKSGKKTAGLGWYYNGCVGKAERGLEISTLAVIDLKRNTAYALDSHPTPNSDDACSLARRYAAQVMAQDQSLKQLGIRHLVVDGWYSKKNFVAPVLDTGLQLVGKLRVDANLRWLYEGPQRSGPGRPRKYEGQVIIDTDLARFDDMGELDCGRYGYTAIVHAVSLGRKVRVVVLRQSDERRVILYSTDTALKPHKIVEFYRARFQIEFLFRDAKQHTGLEHCQAWKEKAIKTHINASLTALNLLKIEDAQCQGDDSVNVISIASWKRRKFNQHLLSRIFSFLDIDESHKIFLKVSEAFGEYGVIAA